MRKTFGNYFPLFFVLWHHRFNVSKNSLHSRALQKVFRLHAQLHAGRARRRSTHCLVRFIFAHFMDSTGPFISYCIPRHLFSRFRMEEIANNVQVCFVWFIFCRLFHRKAQRIIRKIFENLSFLSVDWLIGWLVDWFRIDFFIWSMPNLSLVHCISSSSFSISSVKIEPASRKTRTGLGLPCSTLFLPHKKVFTGCFTANSFVYFQLDMGFCWKSSSFFSAVRPSWDRSGHVSHQESGIRPEKRISGYLRFFNIIADSHVRRMASDKSSIRREQFSAFVAFSPMNPMCLLDWLTYNLLHWLIDWFVIWPIDQLFAWLIDWLIDRY